MNSRDKYVQVRVRKETHEKLITEMRLMEEHFRRNPSVKPPWIQEPITLTGVIMELLWRSECHRARSYRARRRAEKKVAS